MAVTLTGYKLFRHTSDISGQDYAWCSANATLLYSGAGLSYADTGLASDTTYYYKLFTIYDVDGMTYYSNGIAASSTTQQASTPGYQPWENYPDSPVLTSDWAYQSIFFRADVTLIYLLLAKQNPFYFSNNRMYFNGDLLRYKYENGNWTYSAATFGNSYVDCNEIYEANNDIYTSSAYTTVFFPKTTA